MAKLPSHLNSPKQHKYLPELRKQRGTFEKSWVCPAFVFKQSHNAFPLPERSPTHGNFQPLSFKSDQRGTLPKQHHAACRQEDPIFPLPTGGETAREMEMRWRIDLTIR
ncbi:hypothetical protein AVEN_108836-1 [Araneus ventricosus]|uniref:Uncharacterized protein n=1 Tax=Araneus ventricosus TaxID=182803 RepID=A0A4Y2CER4_ARAVE|nr:hypothetical protein AVEN_108836-1 [Araneus ventricosus]